MTTNPNPSPHASSDDLAAGRIATDMLERLTRRAHVDELRRWEGNPWDYDVGLATVRDETFGKLRLPVVVAGEVVAGSDVVEAERFNLLDGGHVLVVDLTETGWTAEQARAWAIGEMTGDRAAVTDEVLLASALARIAEIDRALPRAAGWDDEDLHDLLASAASMLSFPPPGGPPPAYRPPAEPAAPSGPPPADPAPASPPPAASPDPTADEPPAPDPDPEPTYAAAAVRSFVLTYPMDAYQLTVARLAELRRRLGVESNAEAVAVIVAEAFAALPPDGNP